MTHEGEYNPWGELQKEPFRTEYDICQWSGGLVFRDGYVDMRKHPPQHVDDCIVLIRGPWNKWQFAISAPLDKESAGHG